MVQIGEAAVTSKTPLGGALEAGVENISYWQTVPFVLYVRVILPLDGYAFWVRSDLLSQSALLNALQFNKAQFDQPQTVVTPATSIAPKGSLHYATELAQTEEKTFSTNRIVFTSESEVQDLNLVNPNTLYIATLADGTQFAFSGRGMFYTQSGLWHYTGNAVYSSLASQVINDKRDFNTTDPIVSNSLPFWLGMNGYTPQPWEPFSNPSLTLYPSFLVPSNITPAWASVHIDPLVTRASTAQPRLDGNASPTQLCYDRVRVTLYGVRNKQALEFQNFVIQQSLNYGNFGILNMPVIADEKEGQVELNVIAQKKTITFDISYYQSTVENFARAFIQTVIPTYQFTT